MAGKKGLLKPEEYTYIGDTAINEGKFFSRLVTDANGCHVWKGGTHRQGYGMFNVYNTKLQKRQMNVVHRIAMMLHLGKELGRYEFVIHEFCDNQMCCNPAHMIVGTGEDRNRVQYAKGHYPSKGKGPNAIKKQNRKYKWTDDQMRYIRDHTTTEIAAKFGVTKSAAGNMKHSVKNRYKWLD